MVCIDRYNIQFTFTKIKLAILLKKIFWSCCLDNFLIHKDNWLNVVCSHLVSTQCFVCQFFLSLYGHSLPVLSMDISSDSQVLATGSADRSVKIWGLDFGDCHKSILAHDDSVTSVVFVPKTHYFFTCGKDGRVKQWDADSFQKILTLQVSALN